MKVRSFIVWAPLRPGAPGGLTLRWWERGAAVATTLTAGADCPILFLGDDAEWDATHPERNLASGVAVRFDRATGEVVAATSIVGLPPLYAYRGAGIVALTSDLHLLPEEARTPLELDPTGVTELARFGHPAEHRTLFKDVEFLPAGGEARLRAGAPISFRRTWEMPQEDPLSPTEVIEAQVAAFREGVRRTDLEGSFLSLTAGLDTRAVFSALAERGRLLPAVTMTGAQPSLDARVAARLCRAYGVRHELVTFDARFARDLPRLVVASSRTSGGLSSLGQAPEVFLYEQAGAGYRARLSGNLGNQVGRGGTEGVSLRSASLALLAPALRSAEAERSEHWLLEKLRGDPRSRIAFILQGEVPFSSVGNYSVGNHFAAQQSPYASRQLIETLARRPAATVSGPSGSALRMRLRDLRHRFLGENESHSFQRTLVHRIGGAAAHIPINWGWRPAGGVSPVGLAFGVATLAGMAIRAKGLDAGPLGGFVRWSGLPALHDFHESRQWLRADLREFVRDTLASRTVREAGLFEPAVLDPLLDEHFGGVKDHYKSVTFALDLALAQANFCRAGS